MWLYRLSHHCGEFWPTLLYSVASAHWGLQDYSCTALWRSHHSISSLTAPLQQLHSFLFQPFCCTSAAALGSSWWPGSVHASADRRPHAVTLWLHHRAVVGVRCLCCYDVWLYWLCCCVLSPNISTLVLFVPEVFVQVQLCKLNPCCHVRFREKRVFCSHTCSGFFLLLCDEL